MKTFKSLSTILVATAMLVACGGESESPESVAEKYCKAVMSADIKTAVKYSTEDQAEEITEILSDKDIKEFVLNAYRGAKLTLVSVEAIEDGAVTEVVFDVETAPDSEKGDVTMRVTLVKEGRSWKVDEFR